MKDDHSKERARPIIEAYKQQSRMKDAMKPENHGEGVNTLIGLPKAYLETQIWVGVDDCGIKCCSRTRMDVRDYGISGKGYVSNGHHISARLIPEKAFEGLTCADDGQRKIKVRVSIID